MKKIAFSMIAVWLAGGALVAHAGLVMTQETTTNAGGAASKSARTVMVQGSKQKVLMDNQSSIIIDLDKGMMTMIMPEAKSYQEMPFPPKGPMASMMQGMGGINLDFKKPNGHKKIPAYSCDEYNNARNITHNHHTHHARTSK